MHELQIIGAELQKSAYFQGPCEHKDAIQTKKSTIGAEPLFFEQEGDILVYGLCATKDAESYISPHRTFLSNFALHFDTIIEK